MFSQMVHSQTNDVEGQIDTFSPKDECELYVSGICGVGECNMAAGERCDWAKHVGQPSQPCVG